MDSTPYFPGFKPQGGRQRISAQARFKQEYNKVKAYQISHFRNLFQGILPADLFSKKSSQLNSRDRIFTVEVTFWAFLTQVLCGNGSCREAVKAVQGWLNLTIETAVSSNTASYCGARARLSYFRLHTILKHVTTKSSKTSKDQLWCGRRVKMVDGTNLRLADTAKNQHEWPQPSGQKKGCGFPVVQLQGLICLATGTLLDWAETPLTVSDSKAWKALWRFLSVGDVILADRGYDSYAALNLLKKQNVDMVVRKNSRRKFKKENATRIGKNDWLVTWTKPRSKPKGMTEDEWNLLDQEMVVREIRYLVENNGFRTQKVTISSTLLDSKIYTANDLADLYEKRWGIEVRFRDIKTTMGMAELKGKTPDMIKKEIVMMAIGYNLIRALINQALKENSSLSYERVSIAGTLSQIRQQAHNFKDLSIAQLRSMKKLFLESLIDAPVPDRPGRCEPRAVKRRRRKYKLLTVTRSKMIVEPHRDKYRKTD